eukprot:13602962-Ditylum_brightwellii.AAC.1
MGLVERFCYQNCVGGYIVDLNRREGTFGIGCRGGCTNPVDKQTNRGNHNSKEKISIRGNT